MKKLISALLAFGIVTAIALWFAHSRPSTTAATADISGHWKGPQGGLWFNASATYFELDLMHTFIYGHWKATDSTHCQLQFWDSTEIEAVTDRADLRGSATLDRSGPQLAVTITMPDGSTGRFTYLHPPAGEILEMERSLKDGKPK